MEDQIMEEDGKDERSPWSDLPWDILRSILSRLTVVDSTALTAACKSWRRLTITPSIRPFFPRFHDSPSFSESPCLFILNGSLCKLYDPVYNATYCMDAPELSGARIRSSNFGWLLLDKGLTLFFFNPFTKERINLPDLKHNVSHTYNFSHPPTSPDCIVIGLPLGSPELLDVLVIMRGESEWDFLRMATKGKRFLLARRCPPIFRDGIFYFLGATGSIVVYDAKRVEGEIWGKEYRKRNLLWPWSFVEEEDGRMLAVFLSMEYRKVHVARFDPSKMAWQEVRSIGSNKMLYVSDGASYLETSVARGMGNKIYIPRFHRGNGVFYSLATQKYHSVDCSYSSECPVDLPEQRECVWIKPLYRKAADVHHELTW